RARSRITAGCTARRIPSWCSGPTPTANTAGRCARSASIPENCRARPGTPERVLTSRRCRRRRGRLQFVRRQKFQRLLGRVRLAERIALRVLAAELIELDRIGIRLCALRHHIYAEIVRERDDRAQDDGPLALAGRAHERLVDLDG